MRDALPLIRFWLKVDQSGDCWLWTGSTKPNGYGQFHPQRGQTVYAHRFAYEQVVGPIPRGLQIDHRCSNRACVKPEHLELATPARNVLRGNSFTGINSRKTHCPHGHPYDASNTYICRGHRRCRICNRVGVAKYAALRRSG